MKKNIAQLSLSKRYSRIFPAILLSLLSLGSVIALSACQKDSEPAEVQTDVVVQSTPVATSVAGGDQIAEVEVIEGANEEAERDPDLAKLENNIGVAGVTPNAEATSPEQAIKGTQITDVQYRSETGATMSVVFETSATGVLNAIVTLPNKPKMTLSAPEGQGNNPTYRSKDGNVELVSHGGGSSIDLMQNNKITSFQATSAEAEVITEL